MICNKECNSENCTCTYEGCPRKGICCECIKHHRDKGELPACYFNKETEKTFDRSIKNFIDNYEN
jgi:hypothetical protein